MTTFVLIGIVSACLIISLAAFCLGGWAFVEVMSTKKSTHQVQMVPSDYEFNEEKGGFQILTPEQKEKIQESFNA